jgi:hypothetical protein
MAGAAATRDTAATASSKGKPVVSGSMLAWQLDDGTKWVWLKDNARRHNNRIVRSDCNEHDDNSGCCGGGSVIAYPYGELITYPVSTKGKGEGLHPQHTLHLTMHGKAKERCAVVGVDLLLRAVWHAVQHGAGSDHYAGAVCWAGNSNAGMGDRGTSSHCDDLGRSCCGSGESVALCGCQEPDIARNRGHASTAHFGDSHLCRSADHSSVFVVRVGMRKKG